MDKAYILSSLDTILKTLREDRGHISFDDLKNRLNSNGLVIDADNLNKLLDIMELDLYINKPYKENYAITGAGIMFLEYHQGYEKKRTADESDKERISDLEKTSNEILVKTYLLAIIVAIGAVLAGIYYFLEIQKDLNCYFWFQHV